jgi:TPR repeat protein
MAEAMRVFQAEAKLIQAEANGKFTHNVKLDKWDKKIRQVRQQHNLAVLYTMGVGVPLDFRSAYKWFKIAADEGLPEAQLNVGIALQSGMGVKKDYVGAYKYYTLAAARGLPTAAPARDNLAQFLSQFQIRAGQRMAQGFKQRLTQSKGTYRNASKRKANSTKRWAASHRVPIKRPIPTGYPRQVKPVGR